MDQALRWSFNQQLIRKRSSKVGSKTDSNEKKFRAAGCVNTFYKEGKR